MFKKRKHKFNVNDLYALVPEDYECAELVIEDGIVKFVCPSGNAYIIRENGFTYIQV